MYTVQYNIQKYMCIFLSVVLKGNVPPDMAFPFCKWDAEKVNHGTLSNVLASDNKTLNTVMTTL